MSITPVKYVRKPLFVDAVQVTPENFNEVAGWCQGEVIVEEKPLRQYIQVRVTNPMNPRQAQAHVNDWVLYTERGYKVYTPRAFENSFDEYIDPDGTKKSGEGDTTAPAQDVPVPDEVRPDIASGPEGADEPRFAHDDGGDTIEFIPDAALDGAQFTPEHPEVNVPKQ